MTDDNNFLALARKRHSVRAYLPDKVPADQLEYVAECARLAPSAVNRQPWHMFVVDGGEALATLRRAYDRPWFATAPCCIIVCSLPDEAWTRASDAKSHADIDAAIIAEHICLAAADAGLGSCWVCNFDPATVRSILPSDRHYEPIAIIPLGYPDEKTVREPLRKPLGEILSPLHD